MLYPIQWRDFNQLDFVSCSQVLCLLAVDFIGQVNWNSDCGFALLIQSKSEFLVQTGARVFSIFFRRLLSQTLFVQCRLTQKEKG